MSIIKDDDIFYYIDILEGNNYQMLKVKIVEYMTEIQYCIPGGIIEIMIDYLTSWALEDIIGDILHDNNNRGQLLSKYGKEIAVSSDVKKIIIQNIENYRCKIHDLEYKSQYSHEININDMLFTVENICNKIDLFNNSLFEFDFICIEFEIKNHILYIDVNEGRDPESDEYEN